MVKKKVTVNSIVKLVEVWWLFGCKYMRMHERSQLKMIIDKLRKAKLSLMKRGVIAWVKHKFGAYPHLDNTETSQRHFDKWWIVFAQSILLLPSQKCDTTVTSESVSGWISKSLTSSFDGTKQYKPWCFKLWVIYHMKNEFIDRKKLLFHQN